MNLDFSFAYPLRLYLLLLIIPMIFLYVWRNKDKWANIRFSNTLPFKNFRSIRNYLVHLPFILEVLAFSLLVIAFARPRSAQVNKQVSAQGIDIVMAIDISSSMLAEDFRPNRLEAAKREAIKFINARKNDRFAVIAFAGESFTLVPLTLDHAMVINMISKLRNGIVEDGTAIGLGIANSVARLKKSKAKSKVIILLTDGVSNKGNIDPITAAKMAANYGVRIYTIGVGSKAYANIPVKTPMGVDYVKMKVDIDENALQQIAQLTGGKYFRATSDKKLEQIYKEIDKMEKTKLKEKVQIVYDERFPDFVLLAFLVLIFDFLLRTVFLRTYP